jgi:peptidoglycan pentaglycine glycine transferase (the first glycine)
MTTSQAGLAASLSRSVRVQNITDEIQWAAATDSLGGSILQSWQWGEFKRLHGWHPERLLVSKSGEPVAAASVLVRSVGPFSVVYVPRGPAFGESGRDVSSALTLAIDNVSAKSRAAIAFIEPEASNVSLATEGSVRWIPTSIELQPLRTIKVGINRGDEALLAQMKSKTRYNVRLAGRRGVEVRTASISDVARFYEILEETSQRDAFGIHGVDYYADMLNAFGDNGVLLVAEYEGKIAAGAIILKHRNEAVYMFGASSKEFQRHMPSHLLQFEAMRWARDRGCDTYDLWGIPPEDTPPDEAQSGELNVRNGLWGVYRFKQGFGGEVVEYPGVYERQYYPRLVQLWRRFRSGPGV